MDILPLIEYKNCLALAWQQLAMEDRNLMADHVKAQIDAVTHCIEILTKENEFGGITEKTIFSEGWCSSIKGKEMIEYLDKGSRSF